MLVRLFSSEVFGMLLVYVVDRLAVEVCVPIYFHGVQSCVGGVLWVRDVVGCGGNWSLWGFRCVEGGAR